MNEQLFSQIIYSKSYMMNIKDNIMVEFIRFNMDSTLNSQLMVTVF